MQDKKTIKNINCISKNHFLVWRVFVANSKNRLLPLQYVDYHARPTQPVIPNPNPTINEPQPKS